MYLQDVQHSRRSVTPAQREVSQHVYGIYQVLPSPPYEANYQSCIECRKLDVLVWIIPVHQLAHTLVWRRRVREGVDDTYHLVTYLTHARVHVLVP